MNRLTTNELIKGNEYLYTDFPTQHAYRAIYLGMTKEMPNYSNWNVHEFRIFPRTIVINKPYTMRLLEIEVNKSPDISFAELGEYSHWN